MKVDFLIDKTWYTYKARIHASERLQKNANHSEYLLIWYSILAVSLSVVSIRYPHAIGSNTDIVITIISIVVLIISILVTNCDFRGRSLEMRRNYLEIQKLYNLVNGRKGIEVTQEDHDGFIGQYDQFLHEMENHKPIDDKVWRFFSSDNELSRPVSFWDGVVVLSYLAWRLVMLSFLYTAPLVYFYYINVR